MIALLVYLADTKTCSCGHQMFWCVLAGGWVCGYCPQRG